jgi:hypothetical protein
LQKSWYVHEREKEELLGEEEKGRQGGVAMSAGRYPLPNDDLISRDFQLRASSQPGFFLLRKVDGFQNAISVYSKV